MDDTQLWADVSALQDLRPGTKVDVQPVAGALQVGLTVAAVTDDSIIVYAGEGYAVTRLFKYQILGIQLHE